MTEQNSSISRVPTSFTDEIKSIIRTARQKAFRAVNTAMVEAYWDVGRRIVEEEQNGDLRAQYGKQLLKNLALELQEEFSEGYDERELRRMRQFYLAFPIRGTVCPELSWSHYRHLVRIENQEIREFYAREAIENHWSVRILQRNISTLYYQRLLASQEKELVKSEMQSHITQTPAHEFIRNPFVLDFAGLPLSEAYLEKDLESALIVHIQKFLLELGKGFAFVARQQLVRTENSDFRIDLVFYNYLLKCFVLIDLKSTALSHESVGQMDMYVRMYDELRRSPDDNPTIGLILCTDTDEVIAQYSVLKGSEQIFASKYLLYLPTIEELTSEIEREKHFLLAKFEQKLSENPESETEE
jgi:predicted nuclease of restriction endonuclease-like (RecB) superfamily